MIYIKSYFKKELQNAYVEYRISNRKKISFALFLGLISFAIHFMLQTLTESVLMNAVPEIMQTSYFSTLFTYTSIAYFVYVIYFLINYDALSFAEIRKNRWYFLLKMGYQPFPMIFSKLIALLLSLFAVYTIGYFFIILLTIFLKYNFIFAYMPSLYVVGLVDLAVIIIISMTVSLFAKSSTNARYAIFFFATVLIILRVLSGYQEVVSNRVLMQDFSILFDFSRTIYLPLVLIIAFACFFISVFKAKKASQYYSIPYDTYGNILPKDTLLVKYSSKTHKPIPVNNSDGSMLRSKVINVTVTIFLVFFICAALAFNVFVILMSTSQPGKEVTISGQIPYVFKSNTMEPAIMENDLAYFTRVGTGEAVQNGDIVLFLYQNTVYVERVTSIDGDILKVDIDYYPPLSQVGAMIKTINRDTVYGIFSHRSRWLGALILFANTIFGRIVFLVTPAVLLFFYKPIKIFFEKQRARQLADE